MTTQKICTTCKRCSVHCQLQACQSEERLKFCASIEARNLAKVILAYVKKADNSKFAVIFTDEIVEEKQNLYTVKVVTAYGTKKIDKVPITKSFCNSLQRFYFFCELESAMKEEGFSSEEKPEFYAVKFVDWVPSNDVKVLFKHHKK